MKAYWVRGIFTFTGRVPQHYKDVFVLAKGFDDAKDKASRLDRTIRSAQKVFVQAAV